MKKLIEILKALKPEIDFEKEKKLVDTGLLDSMAIVEIISSIEENFDVQINPEDIDPDNFQSVETIWNMIESIKK